MQTSGLRYVSQPTRHVSRVGLGNVASLGLLRKTRNPSENGIIMVPCDFFAFAY